MPNPEIKILRELLCNEDKFVSGSHLASELDVSRVSIRNYFEKLKENGFTITAIRNKGYRLDDEPEPFNPLLFEALYQNFERDFPGHFTFLESVDSTNSYAEKELSTQRPTPFLIIADHQSAGRGRRGRIWHSPKNKNVYLSFAFRPNLPPSRLQTITLWIGLQICLFLRSTLKVEAKIKWPNDLLVKNKKLAGILTEARVDSDTTRDLVIGMGINVNSQKEDFPDELKEMASSLAIEYGKTINVGRLCHQLAKVIIVSYQRFVADDYSIELMEKWPLVDYLAGKEISSGNQTGLAEGITSTGSLRLRQPNNSSVILHSGEVSLSSSDLLRNKTSSNGESRP